MRKLSSSLIGAVTGAMLMSAPAIAEPNEPNCQWEIKPNNGYVQYPLQYPQSCAVKDYDSKEPANQAGSYTS